MYNETDICVDTMLCDGYVLRASDRRRTGGCTDRLPG